MGTDVKNCPYSFRFVFGIVFTKAFVLILICFNTLSLNITLNGINETNLFLLRKTKIILPK